MALALALLCLLLLASARASSSTSRCPDELVRPCLCQTPNEVVCANFTEVGDLQEVFDNSVDHPFEGFTLEDSNVMYLHASWITSKRIHWITVYNSSLTALFDQVPSTDNTLYEVSLHNVRLLRGFQWENFKPLHKLRALVLRDVEIRKIGRALAENVTPTVRRFNFKGTKTNHLEDNAFQPFADLAIIELKDAQVTTLKRSMFANPSSLLVFDFRNNRIQSLPDDMFSNMEHIKDIYLNGNRLVTLPAAAFRDVYGRTLTDLQVLGNPIMCNCSLSWLPSSTALVRVEGHCSAPSNLKNRELSMLEMEDFSYCPHDELETNHEA